MRVLLFCLFGALVSQTVSGFSTPIEKVDFPPPDLELGSVLVNSREISIFSNFFGRAPQENTCSVESKTDLFFVIDGSRSVSMATFHLVAKNIVGDIISKLTVGREDTRVSVIVFSNDIRYVIPLERYNDKNELIRATMSLTYPGGYTDMRQMLRGLRRYLKLAKMSAETKRDSVVVFLTDGKSTNGEVTESELADLHSEVKNAFVVSLRQDISSSAALVRLASSEDYVFQSNQYSAFARALIKSMHGNPRCWNVCYRHARDYNMLAKLLKLLENQRNHLLQVYLSERREEKSLVVYVKSMMREVEQLTMKIHGVCGDESSLSQKLEELNVKYRNVTSGGSITSGANLNFDVVISQLMTTINSLHESMYKQRAEISTKESIVVSQKTEIERITAQYESLLSAKQVIISTYEKNIEEIQEKITHIQTEMTSSHSSLSTLEQLTSNITVQIETEMSLYMELEAQYHELTKRYTLLSKIVGGQETAVFTELELQLKTCESYIQDGFINTLFAIKKGCGKDIIAELEDSSITSYTAGVYESTMTFYKSFDLSRFFASGIFRSITLRLLKKDRTVAEIAFDTRMKSVYNFLDVFQITRSSGFAKHVLQSSHFEKAHGETKNGQLSMFIGDLSEYRRSGRCEDLKGFLVVLSKAHPCFPDITEFPAFLTSLSPLGGALTVEVDELQLVTQEFTDWSTEVVDMSNVMRNQTWKLLLALTTGSGDVNPLLLTDRFTPDFVLTADISKLHRHYKSNMLSRMAISDINKLRLDVRSEFGQPEGFIEFAGPFTYEHYMHEHGLSHIGYSHHWTGWFSSHYVTRAFTFNLESLRSAQFHFNIRNEFFAVGKNLEKSCEHRLYFVLLLNGPDACGCFPTDRTPQVFFAKSGEPVPCNELTRAHQMRLQMLSDTL